MEPLKIFNDTERQQFQIISTVNRFSRISLYYGMIVLMHIKVPDQFGGRGIGSAMAASIELCTSSHINVKVYCPSRLTSNVIPNYSPLVLTLFQASCCPILKPMLPKGCGKKIEFH